MRRTGGGGVEVAVVIGGVVQWVVVADSVVGAIVVVDAVGCVRSRVLVGDAGGVVVVISDFEAVVDMVSDCFPSVVSFSRLILKQIRLVPGDTSPKRLEFFVDSP